MNRYIPTQALRVLLVVLFVLPLSACDAFETLQQEPQNFEPLDVTTAGEAENLLIGLYDELQDSALMDDTVIFAAVAADNGQWIGSFPSWQEVETNNLTPDNAEADAQWFQSFDPINVANLLIARVSSGEIEDLTDERAAEIEGQARFIRAWAYFNLIKWFGNPNDGEQGGVPLELEETDSPDAGFNPRASVDAIYSQIITDLSEAQNLAPSTGSPALITSAAATSLLARAYLYNGQYGLARDAAQEVIRSGDFTLAAEPSDIYAQNSSESIFELQFSEQDANSMYFFALNRQEYGADASLEGAFEAGDLRKAVTIGDEALDSGAFPVVKYFRDTGSDNHYLLRLSEIKLILAEALARVDFAANRDDAVAQVNDIRVRAGLSEIDPTTVNSLDQLIDIVLQERRVELAFEGHRWHDLVRTGRAAEVLDLANPSRDSRWPIPQDEIELNTNLTQNPGY
jgi:starch-binding outer membrane protein, SusD/RagB family